MKKRVFSVKGGEFRKMVDRAQEIWDAELWTAPMLIDEVASWYRQELNHVIELTTCMLEQGFLGREVTRTP